MSNRFIRVIFILSVLVAGLMLAIQYLWIKKAYTLAENDFDRNVKNALKDVGENLMRSNYEKFVAPTDMVKKINNEYYIVKVGDEISYVSLKELLKRELTSQDIKTDFEFGAYDCESEKMKYGERVNMDKKEDIGILPTEFPKLKDINYYFGVNFPNREEYLSGQLKLLKAGTAVLLGLLALLAYIIFIVFKQKRLQEIQKDFVNNMTHEFKTPLSSIKIAAEVFKNPNIVNNPQRILNYATIIGDETEHLIGQVERVLQMASTEKGEVILKKSTFILNDIINEIIMKYRGVIRSREGDITLEAADNHYEITADRLHLRNVISNLVDNAFKYADKIPFLKISITPKDNGYQINVKDNGKGIPKEHIKHIFDKFYRVPTGDVHDVKGFGLGLSYVRLIIKRHGGEIKCVSEFGKGTEFVIFIPK
jgi:two-component system phosphate regulon sensor histidine kinase PhoR